MTTQVDMPASDALDYRNTELVFGVVAPVGTDTGQLSLVLAEHLKKFKYRVDEIRLSEFLRQPPIAKKHGVKLKEGDEAQRINSLMDAGNRVREISGRPDVLALYAASDIARRRPRDDEDQKTSRVAHILLSLKRPEEVAVLRQVYGAGFYLIGVYASEDARVAHLEHEREMSPQEAKALILRDQDEAGEWGQQTRAAFNLADVFVHLDERHYPKFRKSVQRFVDLVFGCPSETPTADENAMFLAFAAALRSADLSRQVGAVVMSERGEVIATGANDVPCFGGGSYWPGDGDQRDFRRGGDSNKEEIERIADDIVRAVLPKASDDDRREASDRVLAESRLGDLTEFGRPVHAEMEALLHCARSGVSPLGGTLFTTTFPCHNCAKHIVAAGIRRVYFVEPYPKSKASVLHSDSISVEREAKGKVVFKPFVGVAARRYFDLFSMRISSGWPMTRKIGTKAIKFNRRSATPRVPMAPTSFVEREEVATKIIRETMG